MGEKDIAARVHMSEKNIFADLFNYRIFGGQQVIRPEELSEMDPAAFLVTGSKKKKSSEFDRDLLNVWAAKHDGRASYVLLGLENQNYIDYAMPARVMLYDALNYSRQIRAVRAVVNEADNAAEKWKNSNEFLSGFRKEDRLLPVITVVLYLGDQKWDGALSIREMLDAEDAAIIELVQDYKMNLICPAEMADEEFQKFRTNIGKVLEFIKYSGDKNLLRQKAETDIITLDKESMRLLNILTNAGFRIDDEGEGEITVCKAIDDIRAEGKAEGRAEGAGKVLQSFLAAGMSMEELASICELDVQEIQKLTAIAAQE